MDVAGWMVDGLGSLPGWLIIIIISMMPFVELRLALPIAIIYYDMNIALAFTLCVVANMVPVPFVLLFFRRAEKWARKYPFWDRLIDKTFERTRKKATKNIQKYEAVGLMLFVGVPLPVTGAWTGSLIAYLFDLDIKKSFLAILGGVIIAGVAILIFSIGLKLAL